MGDHGGGRCAGAITILASTALLLSAAAGAQDDILVPGFGNDGVRSYDASSGAFNQVFVTEADGGLDGPHGACIGPDGHLYVASFHTGNVLRYDGTSGALIDEFIGVGSGGLDGPMHCVFGPDKNFYVASFNNGGVIRYDGATGAFIDHFLAPGSIPSMFSEFLRFGPDGNLYVSTGAILNGILRLDGQTGAIIDLPVLPGAGGLTDPHAFTFGPDGRLYVASFGSHQVLRYNTTTGAFIDEFIGPSSGLISPHGLTFGSDAHLYVTSWGTDEVLRYDGKTGAFIDIFVSANDGGLVNPQQVIFRPDNQLEFFGPFPGSAGVTNLWEVSGAEPGDTISYVVGLTPVFVKVKACLGMSLQTLPLFTVAVPTDGSGNSVFGGPVPIEAIGLTIYVQALDITSCLGSTVIKHTF